MTEPSPLTRRGALRFAAAAALAAVLAPRLAAASEEQVAEELGKLYGQPPAASGRVKLIVPAVAQNGAAVPVRVEVDSPMTDADHVKAVHVLADGNPQPRVMSFHFTPACGRAAAAGRMRLARSQNVLAVAEMADGSLHAAKVPVTVTVGSCGG